MRNRKVLPTKKNAGQTPPHSHTVQGLEERNSSLSTRFLSWKFSQILFIKHFHAFQRRYLGTMKKYLPCLSCCTHVSQNITWKYLEMFPFEPVPRCCFAVYPTNFLLSKSLFTFLQAITTINQTSWPALRSPCCVVTPMVQVKVIAYTQVDEQLDYIICHKRECEQFNPP